MKRLLNLRFVVVALALLAFATTLRSHSPSDDRSALTTGSAPAKKSMAVAGHVAGVFDTDETLEPAGRTRLVFSAVVRPSLKEFTSAQCAIVARPRF